MKKLATVISASFVGLGFATTALAAPVNTTGFLVSDVIFGGGNNDGSFSGTNDGVLELALRAKLRYNPITGTPLNQFNYDGVDSYEFAMNSMVPSDRAVFNYEWSINTSANGTGSDLFTDYMFVIEIDFDGGGTDASYDPLSVVSTGWYFGNNKTPNGGGTFATPAGFGIGSNVAQNSVNFGFSPINGPLGTGNFNISLTAIEKSTNDIAGSTSINVSVSPVPLPASLGFGLAGLTGLAMLRRRKNAS